MAGVGEAKTGQATPEAEQAPEREGKPEDEGALRQLEGITGREWQPRGLSSSQVWLEQDDWQSSERCSLEVE